MARLRDVVADLAANRLNETAALRLPENAQFADLALEREPVTRRLMFAPAPLATICRCNGLDPATVLADEDLSCELICEWYVAHIKAGGAPDVVVEAIVAEVNASLANDVSILRGGGGIQHWRPLDDMTKKLPQGRSTYAPVRVPERR